MSAYASSSPRISHGIGCACVAAALVVWLAACTSAASAAERPNILFIFADDQAYDTIGALGNREIETPHLDELCRRGTVFTHAYNQGGWHGAVCVASRTMLLTGRFLWNARQDRDRLESYYQASGLLWPQLLASGGYDTYFSGKWHVQADAQKAFQTARHVRGGMPKQTDEGYNRPLPDQPDPWKPWDKSRGGFWEGGRHWSAVLADDAVDYLNQASESERPFFMYLAFNAPHDPRQSPREFVQKYPLERISLPVPFYANYPYEIGSNRNRDERLGPFPRTEHAVKVHRQEYYAIISHMDAQIGRILDALAETGQSDNTYIVFTADHGLACGHHGLLGKQNMFDHSVRVPMILVGPAMPGGERIDAPVYLQDVMPTTLELAGVDVPDHVQFRSVLPLVRGERSGSYDAIYGAFMETQRMVTLGDYKLIVYPKIDVRLLFNLRDDPLETTNLADDPAHRGKVHELLARLQQLQTDTGDSLALEASPVR
ncbi:MAG: sulfatase-like hydrolase/transferase [Pirellulales bacterium]